MGVVVENKNHCEINYNFNRKAGRSIIERRPIFSPDGESVLIVVENTVRVYNIQTGDCTQTLETEHPVNELIAVEFPHNETYNLYGCSDDGIVSIWTWDKGAVLKETKLQLPENHKIVTFNLIDANECFVTTTAEKLSHLHLATYSVKTGTLICQFNETRVLSNKKLIRVTLGWCHGERYAAIINGTKSLFIQNLVRTHLKSVVANVGNFRITAVEAHHSENALAITDTLGVVTILRGNLFENKEIARETMHWHSLPPMAISFSVQGSYLITGGMEKVLVKWTLGNLASKANEKAFIPRLPGFVRFISTNNTHIAITLSNNSVVIANAQMRVISTILECGGLSSVVRAIGPSLVYNKPLDALLMGGRTGHLQLYSTKTDKVLYNIDITEMNSIPPERYNLLPLETEVTCAAVNAQGTWLVTSEYRNDGISYPEERLKFWAIQTKNTIPFKLNTCVNLSHGGCNVVSIALNKAGEFCVTAGNDQKFRIWKRSNYSDDNKKISWRCLTSCYYSSGIAQFMSHGLLNNYKTGPAYTPGKVEEYPYLKEYRKNDVIEKLFNIHKEHSMVDENLIYSGVNKSDEFDIGGVAISQDGSLIAAWFGCKLSLWDTYLCNLRTTLSHPALRPKGIDVQFGSGDAAHYLVCTSQNCLMVWSLLSLTVKWMVQLSPSCLVADPSSNKMAVVTTKNDVFVFTPHSSQPILVQKQIKDPSSGVFKKCAFGSATGEGIRLYLTRNDSEMYCLEPEKSEVGALEVLSRVNMPASNFSALIAEQQLSEVRAPTTNALTQVDIASLGNQAVAQFMSAAPHMMPPVSLLCTSFLQHISGMEEEKETPEVDHDIMEVDSSSDNEDMEKSQLNGPYAPKTTELWTPNYEKVKEKRLRKIVEEPFLNLHAAEDIFGV